MTVLTVMTEASKAKTLYYKYYIFLPVYKHQPTHLTSELPPARKSLFYFAIRPGLIISI